MTGFWALGVALASGPAEAGPGTFNLLELGLGTTSAPVDGQPGWAIGLSYGATLKPKWSPLRFYLLANLHGEHLAFEDVYGPWLRRIDLTASISQRTLLPVSRLVRLYAELEIGGRVGIRERLDWARTEAGIEPVLSVALGSQLRWTRGFSTGIRLALEPLEPLILEIDGGYPTRPRITALFTVGAHF